MRWHRNLGDAYLYSKQSEDALRQYDLALRLAPRDIFLLHKKGLALLECGNDMGAAKVLEQVLDIDPNSGTWSTEIAGLKGRLFWQKYQRDGALSDLEVALDAYVQGLNSNLNSHYMADNVGQLRLLLGDPNGARQAFQAGLAALDKTGDRGYWALATKASCYLGLGERTAGLEALEQVLPLGPEPAAIESIKRGLRRLHQGLRGDEEELETWLRTLDAAN